MPERKFNIEFNQTGDHALDYFLGMLSDARITTLQRIKNITAQELDWQFRAGWNTIGALLSHMIALEHYFRIVFVEGRKLTSEEEERWQPALDLGIHIPRLIKGNSVEFYLSAFDESRTLFLESFKRIDFYSFTKRIEDYDPQTGCNLAWVLYHMIEDEIQHRGQISLLRKMYKESNPNN